MHGACSTRGAFACKEHTFGWEGGRTHVMSLLQPLVYVVMGAGGQVRMPGSTVLY